ncbi:unnamed protein product [Dracunculus medinensis]|uniref:RNA-directed DNA polymerase, eukaryota, reverse transcriptase zinc-binding domain protein n=1 Tax=Dracunculus medinensis TaxID=318479 RepID=A0A0N4URP5_DRAME|nr:unnamed protein product [Dracunculus medinensis]
MVRDSKGVLIKSIKDRLIKWKKFFDAKLNHGAPSVASDIADTFAEAYACNCEPTEEEIISVIHKLKVNKTPGKDGLQAELFKYCPSSFITHLQQMYSLV